MALDYGTRVDAAVPNKKGFVRSIANGRILDALSFKKIFIFSF